MMATPLALATPRLIGAPHFPALVIQQSADRTIVKPDDVHGAGNRIGLQCHEQTSAVDGSHLRGAAIWRSSASQRRSASGSAVIGLLSEWSTRTESRQGVTLFHPLFGLDHAWRGVSPGSLRRR